MYLCSITRLLAQAAQEETLESMCGVDLCPNDRSVVESSGACAHWGLV
jgi:hypothetical protein